MGKKVKQKDLIKNDVGLFGIEWNKFDISLFRTRIIAILIIRLDLDVIRAFDAFCKM